MEYPFTFKADTILLNVASILRVVPTSQFVIRSAQCLFVEACCTLIVFVPSRRVLTPSYFRIENVKKINEFQQIKGDMRTATDNALMPSLIYVTFYNNIYATLIHPRHLSHHTHCG